MNTPELGKLQLSVLMAVATLDDEAYGLGVRREVSEVRGREYSVGAIYTTLSRLEEKGLLESWETPPRPERGGRSRRQYELTAAGRTALREARRVAARLWDLEPGVGPA
ncbi:MAG: helix-turn-helix transcriptional regulator [Candidatus Palauibacterales bacterium]|nr:helix-turn-helix transcriptional regulator [Candidatus Palauibacterales bacterium]